MNLLRRLSAVFLVIGLSSGLQAQAAVESQTNSRCKVLSAEQKQLLDRYFEQLSEHHKLMGGIALSQCGQIRYERYQGQADQQQHSIGPDTQMRIGSISKTFTAVMILQLIEKKQLRLETVLATFFPDVPQAKQITISDLLHHRSGLFNFTNASEYLSYLTQPQSTAAMLKRIGAHPLDFAPGSQAAYSNSNYYLLSLILEKVSGLSYAELLEQQIVKPLGLLHTHFGGVARHSQARSFTRSNGQWQQEPETDISIPLGAGGIVSTPRELNVFFRALFQAKLFSQETLGHLTELKEGYGRGIFAFPFGTEQGWGHNGSIDGFVSTAAYFPESDFSIAVLSNGLDLSLNDVALAALSVYHEQNFVLPDFSQKPQALTLNQAEPFVGMYASPEIPLKIRIFWESNQLMAQATGQGAFPLTAYAKGLFGFDEVGVQIQFDDKASVPTFVLTQGGQRFRFQRE